MQYANNLIEYFYLVHNLMNKTHYAVYYVILSGDSEKLIDNKQ